MNFNAYVKSFGVSTLPYIELGIDDRMKLFVDHNQMITLSIDAPAGTFSPETVALIRRLDCASSMSKLELFMMAQMLGKGPKVFAPTAEQMFALERMALNLPIEDFHLPFDTTIIQLPAEYMKARTALSLPKMEPSGQPMFSVLHACKNKALMVHSVLYQSCSIKSWWRPAPEQDVEAWVSTKLGKITDDHLQGMRSSADELTTVCLILRASLNYCLLLDEVGIKRDGPESVNEYNQLVKWCAKSNKHTPTNKKNLIACPIKYSLKTKPTPLIRVVGSESELPNEQPGRSLAPHSRRGYYRFQRFGPGRTEKKRIRIPACIVNAHKLTGPCGGEYKT